MSSTVGVIFFGLVTAIYLYTFYFEYNLYIPPEARSGIKKWQYLTSLNMYLDFLYAAVSCLISLVAVCLGSRRSGVMGSLRSLQDTLFAATIFPYGLFVALVFWGLYAVDRNLIFPKILDSVFPSWLNHVWHTLPVVLLLVDPRLVAHRYPHWRKGLKICVLVSLFYQVHLLLTKAIYDVWIYPVFRVMTNPQTAAFLAVGNLAVMMFYFLGQCFCSWLGKTDGAHMQQKGYGSQKGKSA